MPRRLPGGRLTTSSDLLSLHRAAATRSAATPSRTSAHCDLDEAHLAGRGDHPQSRIFPFARSRHDDRDDRYRSVAARSRASSETQVEFQTCRSIVPGVNAGEVDLQFLRALPLINRQMNRDRIDRAFDEAQSNNGWLIFGHDVAERPRHLWLRPTS